MSSIDKTGNGRWRARYRDPAGKSRSRTFRRKGDAERFLASTATDIHRGDWVDPKLRRALFDEWADAFEDGFVRLAPTTARRYRQLLTLQVRPLVRGATDRRDRLPGRRVVHRRPPPSGLQPEDGARLRVRPLCWS